ncbi:MAG: RNA pseudouridine synthase [Fusobacteriales bacterium]|nr:MAG: RNA pseudouridine synthase [Fusobacteriales bacterium]
MIEFIIDREYENVRIDRFIRKKLSKIYLSDIYKMLRKAKIKVNNKKVSQNYRLKLDDKITIFTNYNFALEEENKETFIDLDKDRKIELEKFIVYEDKDLFIINKNCGDVVHKGSGHDISLLEEYRSFYKNGNINFVNRIDKLTSGLLLGAKNIRTARELAEDIRNNDIQKKYYILVHGIIDEEKYGSSFTLENYLKKDEDKVVLTNDEKKDYKKSISNFKILKKYGKLTLLEAELITGRTHQLRVQLSGINHSIVGDTKYGINNISENIKNDEKMFLFSHYLKIENRNIEINLNIPNFFLHKTNNF